MQSAAELRQQADALVAQERYADASRLYRQEADIRRSKGDFEAAEVEDRKANRYSSGIWLYAYVPGARVNPRPDRAKIEPTYGCYLGAFIDRDERMGEGFMANGQLYRDPAPIARMMGKKHASVFTYLGYGRMLPMGWIDTLKQHGYFPHIGWEPNDGLDQVQRDDYLVAFARQCASVRVPIFLRYASEMNGNWTRYNGNPEEYKKKWRIVHGVMKEYAPNVVMCWCVNSIPKKPIADYYPGDEFVDWVGINFYSVPYYNDNQNESGWFDLPTDQMRYVYDLFSSRKPIAICEYGASRQSKVDMKDITTWAAQKIIEIYTALPRFYPRVKMVNIFDMDNIQHAEPGRQLNNYSVTDNELIRRGYADAIRPPYFLSNLQAPQQAALILPIPEAGLTIPAGPLRFSAWARCYSDPFSVTYYINNNPIFKPIVAPGPREITVKLTPGTFTLTGIVKDKNGRETARAERKIVVR